MKKYYMVIPILLLVFVAIFVLSGRKTTDMPDEGVPISDTPQQQEEQEQPQVANPASVNCEEKGGELEMVSNTDGSQFAMCVFEDYSCEEWALYRDECDIEGDSELILAALKAKGLDLSGMKVDIRTHLGDYIGGSVTPVSEPAGGGYVFAAKVNGEMKIVADGNGTISCEQLEDYPDFPSYLISGCVDENGDLIER